MKIVQAGFQGGKKKTSISWIARVPYIIVSFLAGILTYIGEFSKQAKEDLLYCDWVSISLCIHFSLSKSYLG